MNYNLEVKNNIIILSIEGNILSDLEFKPALDAVNEKIQDNFNFFVVDLSKLKFMNSTGLSFLLTVLTKTRKTGGETILCNIPEQLSKLLVITKLNNVFLVTATVDDAVKKFS